jgi:hypothetical protein
VEFSSDWRVLTSAGRTGTGEGAVAVDRGGPPLIY